jgi:hypothetical protein
MTMVDYMLLLNYGCVGCDVIDYDDVSSVIHSFDVVKLCFYDFIVDIIFPMLLKKKLPVVCHFCVVTVGAITERDCHLKYVGEEM